MFRDVSRVHGSVSCQTCSRMFVLSDGCLTCSWMLVVACSLMLDVFTDVSRVRRVYGCWMCSRRCVVSDVSTDARRVHGC